MKVTVVPNRWFSTNFLARCKKVVCVEVPNHKETSRNSSNTSPAALVSASAFALPSFSFPIS